MIKRLPWTIIVFIPAGLDVEPDTVKGIVVPVRVPVGQKLLER